MNNVKLLHVRIEEVPDYGEHNSYITANFARRFRMVYFDKKRGQVQLIGRNPHYERMVNIKQFPEGYMQKYAR
ncbi:MAG: hypothetical protein LBO71_09380 [Prevotellaceae bacterium]|nr:hypothetical protein [Prevotellaceae bacterium]